MKLFPALLSAPIAALALTGLTACIPTGTTSYNSAPPPGMSMGVAPPPGRTESERQMRKAYYRGPRGNEF